MTDTTTATWRIIRAFPGRWYANYAPCRTGGECKCRLADTWRDAMDYVRGQLRTSEVGERIERDDFDTKEAGK